MKALQRSEAPLGLWNNTPVRRAILDFVHRVSTLGSADFVPPRDRIAVFDHDGTLWCERPVFVQLALAFERVESLAVQFPTLRLEPPFRAVLERDRLQIAMFTKRQALEFVLRIHAGITTDDFTDTVHRWLDTARHGRFGRLVLDCIYRPQVELLAYLRAHDFTVFIVSAGSTDFVQIVAERAYGIPRHQVIGSGVEMRYDYGRRKAQLTRCGEMTSFNDCDVKVQSIQDRIGRRPILAFGNSDGDLAMLQYTACGPGPRLALLLRHDDARREYAYDRDFSLSPLDAALDDLPRIGGRFVSMKDDFRQVFAFDE